MAEATAKADALQAQREVRESAEEASAVSAAKSAEAAKNTAEEKARQARAKARWRKAIRLKFRVPARSFCRLCESPYAC